jgi:hypothetical protein
MSSVNLETSGLSQLGSSFSLFVVFDGDDGPEVHRAMDGQTALIRSALEQERERTLQGLPEQIELERLTHLLADAKENATRLSAQEAAMSGMITAAIGRGDQPTAKDWHEVEKLRKAMGRAREVQSGLESAVDAATQAHREALISAAERWKRERSLELKEQHRLSLDAIVDALKPLIPQAIVAASKLWIVGHLADVLPQVEEPVVESRDRRLRAPESAYERPGPAIPADAKLSSGVEMIVGPEVAP